MDVIEKARTEKASAPERRRIQSVSVGFRLVRALEAAGRPMSLTQLASSADMPTSQAHLYLTSYVHEGLVRQDPVTSRYELGPYALQLGLAAMRALDVVALARDELDVLRERTTESAHFSVWSERGPCIVLNVDGTRPLPFTSRIGFVLPLLASATGRVFLAHLKPQQTADLLAAELRAGKARPGRAELEKLVSEIHARGFSYTNSMVNVGLAALAAPVFDFAHQICGVLTLIGPAGAFSSDPEGEAARSLLASAERLCARLAGRASTPAA